MTWNLRIKDFAKLGLHLSQLRILSSRSVAMNAEVQGAKLCRKVTYLEEPFELVEQNLKQQTLILRSHWPFQGEERATYFEVVLNGNRQLTFTRDEWGKTSGRRLEVPVNLARNTFTRPLTDLEPFFPPTQGDPDS